MSWARLQAMLSSLEMEMPTATGVFEPERAQPFMPPKIEEKLVETSKVNDMFRNKSIFVLSGTSQLVEQTRLSLDREI